MEELFEFDLSDVDVAAFESVVTDPSQTSGQFTDPGEQISAQVEQQQQQQQQQRQQEHEHEERQQQQEQPQQEQPQIQESQDQHQGGELHPPAPTPPLQQQQPPNTIQLQLQNHQIAAAAGQRPCKILLIPINQVQFNSWSKPNTPALKASSSQPQFLLPQHLKQEQHHHKQEQQQHHQQQQPLQPQQQQQQQQSSQPISNEVPARKPCNCTKSQCLKLYCDCFANGEFCSGCNCKDCYNSLSKEKERQRAITQCLERNPEAFRPKIGKAIKATESVERQHTKGCNCKRSGCLKNYCECYEAKILCSNLCKCCGCKNYEESFERKELASSRSYTARGILRSLLPTSTNTNPRQGSVLGAFINKEVIQASLVCLLQAAQQAEKDGSQASDLIQAEMGKCLGMIASEVRDFQKTSKM